MMKKIFSAMMAFAILFATSCQNDLDTAATTGDVAEVTFSLTTEDATRAYGDGATATVLKYAVYDADGVILPQQTKEDATINGSTTVRFTLTSGKSYSFIFWAGAADAPYTVDLANKTMTVDYAGAKSNAENRDAFYAYKEVNVAGNSTFTVELKRPFAQLNIGTNDYAASEAAGYAPTQTAVKVKSIYKTLNLATGVATGDAEITFDYAAIPNNETFPVTGDYKYLAMNYLLVGQNAGDKQVVDIVFSHKEDTGDETSRTVGSVPVQRNYRTNIYGKLLTNDLDINIEIKPGFGGDINNEGYFIDENGAAKVVTAKGLVTVAEDIKNGVLGNDADIALGSDIDLAELAAATRSASETSNWTPIGTEEKPFTGTLNGNGFSIKNLVIVESEAKEGKAFIGFFGYAKNVTIKDVTFENVNINIPCLDIDHSQGHIGAIAGSLEGTCTIENVTVKGDVKVYSTQDANGASRVAVVAGGNSYGNVTMKNVHVNANEGSYLIANNNTGALAGQLQGECNFENCSSNIDVTVNKFFAGGIIGLTAAKSTFVNCHTTGDIAVVAGREGRNHDQYRVGGIAGGWSDGAKNVCTLTECSYTGKVSGKNSDGSVAEPLDYMGYVGRGYTLNGCQGSKVIIDGIEFVQKYNTAAEAGIYIVNGVLVANVRTLDEFKAALNSEESVNIVFFADIAGDVTVLQKEAINVTIDGNGKKYNGVITVNGNGRSTGAETLTFKNINFNAENATEGFTFINAPSKIGNKYNYSHNITIDGCTFTGNYPAVEVGSASFTGVYNLVMKNCTATKMHSALQAQSCDNTVLVDNVTVEGGKNGISFGNTAYPTLKNSTINAAEYGVRADGNASRGNLVVENTTIDAKQGIVVRKTTTAGYSVKLGENVNITTDEDFEVVFTKGSDDAAYVAPEVAYSYQSVASFNVFPYGVVVNSAEELATWLSQDAVKNITLGAGNFGTIVAKSGFTFIGTEDANVDAVNLNGADDVTLINIAFDAANAIMGYDGNGNERFFANIITGDTNKPGKGARNLVIDGCTFTGTFANGGIAISFNDQGRGTGQSGNITIKNCTFDTENAYCSIYTYYSGYGYLVIENNTFNPNIDRPIYLGRYQSSTPVVVKGNTFEGIDQFSNAAYIQAHSTAYNVSFDASNNTFNN